jgi:hypothetical protein
MYASRRERGRSIFGKRAIAYTAGEFAKVAKTTTLRLSYQSGDAFRVLQYALISPSISVSKICYPVVLAS